MENLIVDKDDFYNLAKKIFNDVYGEVEIEKLPGRKQRYKKVDNDYYKCEVEYYCLRDENDNIMLISEKPISGEKHNGTAIIGNTKKFDASYLSLEEIKELINCDKERYPFIAGIPILIESVTSKMKTNSPLKLDTKIIELAAEAYNSYLLHRENNKTRKRD